MKGWALRLAQHCKNESNHLLTTMRITPLLVSGFVEARHFGCFDALSRISADELI